MYVHTHIYIYKYTYVYVTSITKIKWKVTDCNLAKKKKKMLFPAQSWLNEAINHMSKTCQASARTEVGSESDENRIVEQWAFYSLSLPWQVTTKGSVLSPLLMVQWHIFYCSSFVWPSSSSFQWAASPWAAAKIYIFPANDVSSMVPGWFSHLMKFICGWGPQSVTVLQMELDVRLVFFYSLWTDKPCIFLFYQGFTPRRGSSSLFTL